MVNKRLFLALPSGDETIFRQTLSELGKITSRDSINWIQPGNLHLTIRFIGETSENRIPAIINAMENAAKRIAPYESRIAKIGLFGSSYQPRVIWAGWNDEGHTLALHEQLKSELQKAGFPADRQNFVPHLTLGRIRHIADKRFFSKQIASMSEREFGMVFNDRLILFESELNPCGPEYNILNLTPLG